MKTTHDSRSQHGLHLLGQRFGGRITFWCPVDIQATVTGKSLLTCSALSKTTLCR